MKLSSVLHRKKVLWMPIIVMLLVGVTLVNIASASPDTYFWVDPPVVEETPTGKFQININIADAPPTYAWYIRLSWDPDRLELVPIWDPYKERWVNVTEGDFLDRRYWDPFWEDWVYPYATSFVYVPLDEANLEGEIMIGCSLLTDLPEEEWASGDGWLTTLSFLVQAEGAAHLNLFDTHLATHLEEEYPAYTYYDNVDSLVKATNFYFAGLAGWELKVNGKAGISVGGGLKTTVGTENVLEALVENSGTFDVYVQVFFEIRDGAGYWVATIASGIELLTAGKSTTLSANWIADDPNIYYITAYSFYGELEPTISGGFSRTVRLKAVL